MKLKQFCEIVTPLNKKSEGMSMSVQTKSVIVRTNCDLSGQLANTISSTVHCTCLLICELCVYGLVYVMLSFTSG